MPLSAEELAILEAYSAGGLSWREACKQLRLMDIGELHALLDNWSLPAPPADMNPPDEAEVKRFTTFVEGKE